MNNAVPIIPVLVGLARMPQPAQLLASLNNFAFLNAAPVDTGRDFHQHMERLIRSIDQIVPDRHATSLATSASREEAATPAAPATADRRGDADIPDFTVFRDAPYAPELVVIPAGEFMMGSTDAGHPDERPQHRVTIARHFAIGRYPVTFDEYDRFCDAMRREKPGDQGWGRRAAAGHQRQLGRCAGLRVLAIEGNRPGLSAALRSGMGICLPGRHDGPLFLRRRNNTR